MKNYITGGGELANDLTLLISDLGGLILWLVSELM